MMSPPIDPSLTAGKSAYMASKFAMTFTAFAAAEEWARFRVSSNALWPETLIQSAATETYQIGNERKWYKSELVSDAAMNILEKNANGADGTVPHGHGGAPRQRGGRFHTLSLRPKCRATRSDRL